MKNTICRGRRPRRPAKRIISLILSLIMLSSITAGLDFSAFALASSGSCGTNVKWTFVSSTGTLTISGTGAMTNYTYSNGSFNSPFYSQSGIKTVLINSGVTSIGSYAFYNCTGLTSITIPDSVTSIGEAVFVDCTSLESIIIPNSVTSINNAAFHGCSRLKSLAIGNSVTTIYGNAFGHCNGLTSITVGSGNTKYDSRNNCNAIIETSTNTLKLGCINTVIPNDITCIGSTAFYKCSFSSIKIPKSVVSIGVSAFYGCSNLKYVYYDGTKSEWSKIDIDDSCGYNDYLQNALVICIDSTINCNHVYDNGIISIQPTCTTPGVKTFTCMVCGDIKTESISATHTYNNGTITTQPTCTKTGVKKSTCTVCGTTKTETVPALGHNYIERVARTATCTESGIKTYTCTRCNNSYSQTVNALGHNYKSTIKKATPTEGGYSDTVCTRCGDEHYKYIDSPDAFITRNVFQYNGKTKKPKVKVYKGGGSDSYLSKENYSVIYPKESKKLGTYTVKIVLKGAYYSGTFEEKFRILPKSVNHKKIKTKPYSKEQISVSWKKVKGVDGYVIYRWSDKKGFVKYKKTKKTSIKIKRENKKNNLVDFAIATYKKQGKKTYESGLVGGSDWVKLSAPTFKIEQNEIKEFTMVFPYKDFYYIQWSNNANFSVDDKNTSKNYWVKTGMYADKNNDPTKQVSRIRVFGLKANQTVYVRARKVYYNKKGKLVLGPWSKAKKVITY